MENEPNAFTAAYDGSVINDRGTSATSVHFHNNQNQAIQSMVPVDGHNKNLTSYMAELFGIFAVMPRINQRKKM